MQEALKLYSENSSILFVRHNHIVVRFLNMNIALNMEIYVLMYLTRFKKNQMF